MRIHSLDKLDLSPANPAFELLLSGDRGVRIEEHLAVNKSSEVVATRKTGNQFVFVLEYPANQASSNANIEYVMPGSVTHDVHEEAFRCSQSSALRTPDPSLRLKNGCAQDDAAYAKFSGRWWTAVCDV